VSHARRIVTADDVTPAILERAEQIYSGWYAGDNGRVDWEDFIYRLEESDEDFGASMLSPAIKKIQRHIRACAQH
jgi:hypothetical protein